LKAVFADTLYWIAVTNPHDPWNKAAKAAREALGACQIITTDSILLEYLTSFAGQGNFSRKRAVLTVRHLLHSPFVRVIQQTREVFLQGIEFYANREDKAYSLADCISMIIMQEESISAILTNDHHFTQEGFEILIS
jgi:predicted nucleic acid-binding protein